MGIEKCYFSSLLGVKTSNNNNRRSLEQPATAKLQAKIAFFRFLPFVKLTVITGVSWVFEVVSFFTNGLAGMAYLE